MVKRNLTDTERLEVVVNLLDKRALEQYQEQCEKLEKTPPLWEAGVCPACGGEYYGEEIQEVNSDEESEIRTYKCPNCNSTVKEYFELVNITAEP